MPPKFLGQIENLIQCPICGSHLQVAMSIASCSHTYCSVCIRRALGAKPECPTCRIAVTDADLVNNRFADSVVSLFLGGKSAPQDAPAESNDDVMIVSKPSPTAKKALVTSPTSDGDRVQCPICGLSMSGTAVNAHLDTCLARKGTAAPISPKGASATHPPRNQRRMPKYVYDIMSDKQLRKLLKESSLPTSGTRRQMIARHREYALQVNARLDAGDSAGAAAKTAMRLVAKSESALARAAKVSTSATTTTTAVPASAAPVPSSATTANGAAAARIVVVDSVAAPADSSVTATSITTTTAHTADSVQFGDLTRGLIIREMQRRGITNAEEMIPVVVPPWRCVYSVRANRPFYFNTVTQIGQWEPPLEQLSAFDYHVFAQETVHSTVTLAIDAEEPTMEEPPSSPIITSQRVTRSASQQSGSASKRRRKDVSDEY
eukprot:TRINITY_DN3467_c0_g1_i1.p1 TRINITY_DN3467_c0_g1~~TRINITY_DN3467_c0_g1_i1.p1  ORF type:complete len:434 (+),score=64.27 TRINITY_DN3467_c0_g1_i1:25-1326(+)